MIAVIIKYKYILFLLFSQLESCKNAFVPPSDISWDYVINCAGETKQSQVDPVYKEGILKLSINCAKEAAQYQVKRYVELSAGQLFSSSKTPHKESDDVSPWTNIAKWKWQVTTNHFNYNI